jgi:hypothetical protein
MGYFPWMVLMSDGLMGACVSSNSMIGSMAWQDVGVRQVGGGKVVEKTHHKHLDMDGGGT